MKKALILAIAVVAVMATVLGCKGKKETGAPSGEVAASGQTANIETVETEQAADSGTETTATATNFTRVIELKSPRMNGEDIVALQKQLLSLGYDSVGEADGYYGTATEKVVKYIQFFPGGKVGDGKVNQPWWNYIFTDYDGDVYLLKRGSFAANTAIDASTVLDVFQKFIGWKDIDGYYYRNESDIDRDPKKIANGLLNNREYVYTSIESYANTDYETSTRYYFSPEHNLVLRTDNGEMAPRREFILPDFRKFIHRVYHGLTGWHSYDEIYDFDPQTGVFTLLETIDYQSILWGHLK